MDGTVLTRMRAWLDAAGLPAGGRLPAERAMAGQLGVKRTELRKALAVLETEGKVWRHVGKGTFLSAAPGAVPATVDAVAAIAERTSPLDAMQARLIVEPEIARLAALQATSAAIGDLRDLTARMRAAKTWAGYEDLDWQFHGALAEASGNVLLIEIQRLLNGVRRRVVWGHLARRPVGPAADYHSFDEHDAIVAAIAERDRRAAAEAMRRHLNSTASALMQEG